MNPRRRREEVCRGTGLRISLNLYGQACGAAYREAIRVPGGGRRQITA